MTTNPNLPVVHNTGGAPAYDDKVRRTIYANLKLGCTRSAAYLSAGISEPTFYRWLKESDSFRENVEAAEGAAERSFTRTLRVASAAGDVTAAKFWLERRRPKHWRERIVVEESSLPLEDEIDEAFNRDDVDRRLQALTDDALRRRTRGADGDAGGAAGEAGSPAEPS